MVKSGMPFCSRFIIETVSPGGRFTELGMSVLKLRSLRKPRKLYNSQAPHRDLMSSALIATGRRILSGAA